MKADNEFWLARWAENRIGFHRDEVQPLLERFWGDAAPRGGRVLVPLCGKTYDMIWLAGRGHPVVGVDLSPVAARSFAAEQGVEFTVSEDPPFTVWHSDMIDFRVGDFFSVTAENAGRFPLVYDRAALVALPAHRRRDYVQHLETLLELECHILLITLEYDQASMEGPPFAVGEEEVRDLYREFSVNLVERRECLEKEPRFKARGLRWMNETVYRVDRPRVGERSS